MEYVVIDHVKRLCLEYADIVPHIMTKANYDQLKHRGSIKAHGRGGNGRKVWIEYESLPSQYRRLIDAKVGDAYEYAAHQPLLKLVREDHKARDYYIGKNLSPELINKYGRQADWLNMIINVQNDKTYLKHVTDISMEQFWNIVINLYNNDPAKPELPGTKRRLLDKIVVYKKEGYEGLISKKLGNQNSRKVTPTIERLILSLYITYDKPYLKTVCTDYLKFIAGKIDILDFETGELYDPKDFYVNGKPYLIGESTVDYYIKKPINHAAVDTFRLSKKQHNDKHRPHMHRKHPFFAFSKITMDDTSSPFKMLNGDRPATYKVFDVASTALIAMVMTPKPSADADLVRELMREIFRTVLKNGWGIPGEVEVEHAINRGLTGKDNKETGEFEADILTNGNIFPFVTFCAPKNPQEKRAEGFIRKIKYGYQKHRQGFQNRPHHRLSANRFNEDTDANILFTFEEIYQMELEDMWDYNHELHPDQETYPGLTRWEVVEQFQNPLCRKFNPSQIIQYIGYRTKKTSYRRGEVQVQGNKYRFPDLATIKALANDEFTAYWLPDDNGVVEKVYLFQDGEFVTEACLTQEFQEAKLEQTPDDLAILEQQRAYRSGIDKAIETTAADLLRVGVIRKKKERITKATGEIIGSTEAINSTEKAAKQGGYLQNNGSSNGDGYRGNSAASRALSDI